MRSALILVACAAPPTSQAGGLVELLVADGWDVYVVLSEGATAWADEEALAAASGHPVKTRLRRPDEVKTVPVPAAVVVAPATFNTINQWAAGINNTAALGVLNEALGAGVPMIVSPHTKDELAAHPAFRRSVEVLSGAGVRFHGDR